MGRLGLITHPIEAQWLCGAFGAIGDPASAAETSKIRNQCGRLRQLSMSRLDGWYAWGGVGRVWRVVPDTLA